jgi:hypothetical protein
MHQKESALCQQFVKFLVELERVELFSYGGSPVIWFHVRNEFTGSYNPVFGRTKKKEGVKAGVADYIFLWKNGCGCLEFKSKSGTLSSSQKQFQSDCKKSQINYAVARSPQEGLNVLQSWGILKPY